jgi:hypothetical protein
MLIQEHLEVAQAVEEALEDQRAADAIGIGQVESRDVGDQIGEGLAQVQLAGVEGGILARSQPASRSER